MQRAETGIRRETRLSRIAAANPEWHGWLQLLQLVQQELANERWHARAMELSSAVYAGRPLLHGSTLHVDQAAAADWLNVFFDAASTHGNASAQMYLTLRRANPLALLSCAVASDNTAIAQLVQSPEEDVHGAAPILQLAVVPLLRACGAGLAARIPEIWPYGYCPICGAWPTLSEMRGIERTRMLRCVRCGCGWRRNVLWCPYCGEDDHRRLGSLKPEGDNPIRHVEVCGTCSGYLKVLITLQAVGPADLALEDLETVELDVIAMEHGFKRPADPGCAACVRLV